MISIKFLRTCEILRILVFRDVWYYLILENRESYFNLTSIILENRDSQVSEEVFYLLVNFTSRFSALQKSILPSSLFAIKYLENPIFRIPQKKFLKILTGKCLRA